MLCRFNRGAADHYGVCFARHKPPSLSGFTNARKIHEFAASEYKKSSVDKSQTIEVRDRRLSSEGPRKN